MDGRQGFRLGAIRGIPIRIHPTFLLVLPFLAWVFGRDYLGGAHSAGLAPPALLSWVWGIGLALALFLSVLIHELAHSLYAVAKGGRVRSITLLMIGGVSELIEAPRDPGQEAAMAAIGPATSLVLGGIGWLAYRVSAGETGFGLQFALFTVAELNLGLGLFNLLPAFPMDGGRVLRGILARRTGMSRATRIAAAVGKVFALLFALFGLLSGNFLLILIAFFVFGGAQAEERQVLATAVLGELRLRDVMSPPAQPVAPGDTLLDVGERMVRERRLAYPVVEDGQVLGLVSAEAVAQVAPEERPRTPVQAAMEPALVLGPDEKVAEALRGLSGRGASQLVVAGAGEPVGLVSQAEIVRAVRLRQLQEARWPRRWRRAAV